MSHNFDFDLFVIGGGSGGVRAARMAAARGAKVALAETAKMGGACVNVGCIPKKLYSFAAHYAESFEESRGFGWEFQDQPTLNWEKLKSARAQEITRLNGIYGNLMQNAQVQHFHAHASLVDAHTVQIKTSTGDEFKKTAKHILIATGGKPFVPDFEGKEHVITSDDIFDLPHFPEKMVVVGTGYIGCEMASIFNGLGAQVHLLLRSDKILRGFDEEVRIFVAAEMQKHGVHFHPHSQVQRVQKQSDGTLKVELQNGQSLAANAVLYATGRKPQVQTLGLEKIGVTQKENGAIVINEHFQTNIPSIYAVGDVAGRKELTPVALAEAMVLVDALFGAAPGKTPRTMSYDNIPTAVFTHPSIGTVGLSEEKAREYVAQKGGSGVRVYRSDFRPLKHTLSGSSERVLVKIIVEDATDRVLGAHMVGADAGEIIQGFAVALQCGATKSQFDATLGIHPTTAEELVTLREVSRR